MKSVNLTSEEIEMMSCDILMKKCEITRNDNTLMVLTDEEKKNVELCNSILKKLKYSSEYE